MQGFLLIIIIFKVFTYLYTLLYVRNISHAKTGKMLFNSVRNMVVLLFIVVFFVCFI